MIGIAHGPMDDPSSRRGNRLPMIIDAQVHVWLPESHQRPRPGWAAQFSLGRDAVSIEEVRGQLDREGVQRAVLVPPTFVGNDNSDALEAARSDPDRFAVVGRLVPDDPTAAVHLPGWRSQPGMKGLRAIFVGRFARCLIDGSSDWLFSGAAEHDIPLMVFAPGRHEVLLHLCRRFPGLRLIVDHMNLTHAAQDPARLDQEIAALLPLADAAGIGVKLSGLPYRSYGPYPFVGLHGALRRVIETFGPERCFWGSDLTQLQVPYRETLDLFLDELPFLRGAQLELVMGGALARWLDWA